MNTDHLFVSFYIALITYFSEWFQYFFLFERINERT